MANELEEITIAIDSIATQLSTQNDLLIMLMNKLEMKK